MYFCPLAAEVDDQAYIATPEDRVVEKDGLGTILEVIQHALNGLIDIFIFERIKVANYTGAFRTVKTVIWAGVGDHEVSCARDVTVGFEDGEARTDGEGLVR